MTTRAAGLVLSLLLLLPACAARPPAPPDFFPHGVASGDMRADSAVLWTRTRAPARVVPELSRSAGFENVVALPPVETRAQADFTAKAIATGLQPGSRYYYRFRASDALSTVGSLRTPPAPDEHATVRMAFSGDADWKWKPYPLVEALVHENLDFFVFLGDVVYETLDLAGDKVAESLDEYRSKYRENREPRENSASGMAPLRDLYAAFGQYSVFDNHEIGLSGRGDAPPYTEGGARYRDGFVNRSEGFRERLQAYAEYQPVRLATGAADDARTAGTPRFYDAIAWGANVELIVLDDRSYRDASIPQADDPGADSCERTMLGAPQLAWFQQALLAAQRRGATWKVVVISSPIQELGRASQVGLDLDSFKGWAGNYRCERSRVLQFIDEHAIDNVVFLTTDYHFTAINDLFYQARPGDRTSARKRARNAFEIMTGPLGAITGSPLRNRVPFAGLAPREADARILGELNADLAKAGLDPIGLEADFPGLDVASVRVAGGRSGAAQPLAFVSFASYAYVVLTFDQSRVHVQAKAMPYVADPATLLDAATEARYERARQAEVFSFDVNAR